MTEHTKLPWAYRPNEFDDWGWIRGPKEDGISPLAAIARGSSDIDHEEHRRNGTDPYAANAALIVQAVNSYSEMREALENLIEDATESEKSRHFDYAGIGETFRESEVLVAARKALATDREVKDAISIDHRAN